MLELAVSAIGGTLGLLLIVNLFRWLAGVRFDHWRHIVGAYSAGFLLAILAMVSFWLHRWPWLSSGCCYAEDNQRPALPIAPAATEWRDQTRAARSMPSLSSGPNSFSIIGRTFSANCSMDRNAVLCGDAPAWKCSSM